MYLDKIEEYKAKQQHQKELTDQADSVSKASARVERQIVVQSEKTRRNTQKVKSVDPIATPADIDKVVAKLEQLKTELKPAELKPVVDELQKVITSLSKLPTKFPDFPQFPAFPKFPDFPKSTKVDNLTDIKPWLVAIVEAVGKLKLDPTIAVQQPDINIPETKLDLSDITKGLDRMEKSLSKIKIPEVNFSQLESAVKATTSAINGLSFPMPNYILPFKGDNGEATQAQLTDGALPVSQRDFDYIGVTNDGDTDTLTFKTGGSGGETVRTLTIGYAVGAEKVSDSITSLGYS